MKVISGKKENTPKREDVETMFCFGGGRERVEKMGIANGA